MNIADEITRFLHGRGANLVGFASLADLPVSARQALPRAVAFAVALAPEIVASIKDGPTKEYYAEYNRTNLLLGDLSESAANLLRRQGYQAVSSAATNEGIDRKTDSTLLPHKTVATLAGLGWIGKCALLVNEDFGAAIRLNRVLTDAPVPTATPIITSRCGECRACVDACPGLAATGESWHQDKRRDDFFNAFACRRAARETARRKTGIIDTFCGICIAVCPWTQKYVGKSVGLARPSAPL